MSCKANERHITFEEGCWTFHPNSLYHTMMLLYTQEEHVSCQCTFGSRLHEEREKVNSLCECSEGSFLTGIAHESSAATAANAQVHDNGAPECTASDSGAPEGYRRKEPFQEKGSARLHSFRIAERLSEKGAF